MGKSLTRKIIESHFVSGSMVPGEEVFIHVDQTLTHDINAVMTYLAFEAVGLPRVRTECSVSYLDHNLLYVNNMTPDDHIYLQSVAKKYGVYVSRPGNGICHTVHVARFGAPGKVSMGGDSHTPHGGAIGMLCIGVGGMDVATAEEILGEDIAILGRIKEPDQYIVDDSMLIPPLPAQEAAKVEITRGPNIKFLPIPEVPQQYLKAGVSLKARDNVSTDDITPASAEFSSMRSNIPLMSKYCYTRYDPEFAERARSMGQSFIIGGENYGQGSSREHAAINPMYLGVRCVIAKSIARIHKGNLVNHGIIPMLFADPAAYDSIDQGDELEIENLLDQIPTRKVTVKNATKHFEFQVTLDLTDNEIDVVLCGGQLRYLKKQLAERDG